LQGFSGPLGLKWGFWRQNKGRGGAILTPNELVLTFGGSYVCANFDENRSEKCDRESTHRQTDTLTHTLTDADRFCNLSDAIYAIDY